MTHVLLSILDDGILFLILKAWFPFGKKASFSEPSLVTTVGDQDAWSSFQLK